MRAGKLDRRITIRRYTRTRDAFNNPVQTWADVATVWAQQRPSRGNERFAAQEIAGAAVMTFHIRHRADLTSRDRVSYDGIEWNILDVREIGRRVVTEIDCTARPDLRTDTFFIVLRDGTFVTDRDGTEVTIREL